MSKGRQKVLFEGLLQKDVLGTFTVIRGFADLHDLTLVSKAIPYQAGPAGQATGYQRKLDDDHIADDEAWGLVLNRAELQESRFDLFKREFRVKPRRNVGLVVEQLQCVQDLVTAVALGSRDH